MGYERKRGKLADLNAMLRGAKGRFAEVVGDVAILQSVRYVITLDTDTQLPRDAARLMVGTLAHRLNRPVFDAQNRRVVDGYTILQPRVGVSLPSARRSRFVQLYAGDPGVDPYTRVVSDVYQDLFGEGSFIGKGIYDVDSFEQCCGDFPENAILSHDLIEGAYCSFGPAQRCDAVRRASVAVRGRHRPPASLDARRLADRRLAAAVGARAVRPMRPQPDLCLVAVEDFRQSPPQPDAGGNAPPAACLLVRLAGDGSGLAALRGERGPAADAVRRCGGSASQAG